MTRIILVIDTQPQATYITDDPRPVRELIKLINTGRMVVGLGEINLGGGPVQQYAMAMPSQNTITVMKAPVPVRLSRRLYDVLHSLADGKTGDQIALKYGLGPRTVSLYTYELKKRFGVQTREELLVRAAEMGLL
jgi:DNA-binding CsgD family transcriptional regulator